MLLNYHSELNESKPEAQGQIRNVRGTWFLRTPLLLKNSRGIKFLNVIDSSELTAQGQYMSGWNRYQLTDKALEKLCEQYDFSQDILLD